MEAAFTKFSNTASRLAGHYSVFFVALLLVIVWALLGPPLQFNDGWQLSINTGTTIITFLMVFLIQGTQNRSDKAIHLKLDEIILKLEEADDTLTEIEDDTEHAMDERRALNKKETS